MDDFDLEEDSTANFQANFNDYCSTFTDTNLSLFPDSDVDFDRQYGLELGLPELELGDFFTLSSGREVANHPTARFSDEIQLDFALFSSDIHQVSMRDENLPSSTTQQVSRLYSPPGKTTKGAKRRLVEEPSTADVQQNISSTQRGKWENAVTVFSSDSTAKVVQRRRKPFEPSRKKEVALNRAIGACILCRLKKGSCNFGIPCDSCIRRAGSFALAESICTRRSLVATRFDHVDLFPAALYARRVHELGLPSVNGAQKFVFIGYLQYEYVDLPENYIKVPIVDFQHPDIPQTREVVNITYSDFRKFTIPDSKCAVSWNSLMDFEPFLQSDRVLKCRDIAFGGPFRGLQVSVGRFTEYYSNNAKKLPLQAFVKSVLRLRCLFDMYKATPTLKVSLETSERKYASHAISIQLRFLLLRLVAKQEVEVLSEIDKIARGSGRIGRQTPIAIWVSLWMLMLTYKEHMIYVKACLQWVESGPEGFALVQHLYNAIASMYSALYKTTSPLMLDWRTEEIARMLGSDPELIRLFSIIKAENVLVP